MSAKQHQPMGSDRTNYRETGRRGDYRNWSFALLSNLAKVSFARVRSVP